MSDAEAAAGNSARLLDLHRLMRRVRAFEDGLLGQVRSRHPGILESIRTSRDLTDNNAAELKGAVESFAKSFA